MKFEVLLLVAVTALAGACRGGAIERPPCPHGTQAMGQPPPDGDETWCQKIVGGEPVKEGPFVLYRPDGSKMMQGSYRDGKQDGEWTMWYDNGQRASVDHYKNGVQDGQHIGWYTNGKISAMGQYVNGKRDGKWKRWDPNGFRNWEETYKDDKRIS